MYKGYNYMDSSCFLNYDPFYNPMYENEMMVAKPTCYPYDYMVEDYEEICVKKPKKEYSIKVPEVIGRNASEELLEIVIPFPRGAEAIEIVEVKTEVICDIVEVVRDKVLINGRLHKNILYKTKEDSRYENRCCDDMKIVNGDVRHVSVWVPFSTFINIPGALPGDMYEIEYANADCDQSVDILMDPLPYCHDGITRYQKLREKTIVTIDVKVLRHTQIMIDR